MKKKITSLLLAVVMSLSIIVPAAATEYKSNPVEIGSSPYYYKLWNSMYVDGYQFRAATWIEKTDRMPAPAGYLGANAKLFSENWGRVAVDTGWQYNTSSDYFIFPTTTSRGGGGDVMYSKGDATVYYAGSFRSVDVPETEKQGRSELSRELLATLDSNENYPTNAHGHTYGSLLLSDIVGCDPNLISAEGTDGVYGYVLAHDLNPDISTPEEAIAYMETFEDHLVLPLYDVDENVIGTFVLEPGIDPNSSEFAGCTLEEAQAKVESGAYTERPEITQLPQSPEELAALASQSRHCIYYPENSIGQTYGLPTHVGHEPDLIAVATTSGETGYARRADLAAPKFSAPEDVEAYMRSPQSKSSLIPVYDLEGHEIGQFARECGEFIHG